MTLTTWRKEFAEARTFSEYGKPPQVDTTAVVAVAPDESVLDVEFDPSYGGTEGRSFLIWTEDRVYFPVCYDGAEWVGSAPRNPVAEGQNHVGGG